MSCRRHEPWRSLIVDIWADYSTALHRAEAFEACRQAEQQGLRPCVLRAGPHVFPRERPIRMHDGLGLVINVPMIINEEEWNYYIRPRMEQWTDVDVITQTDRQENDDTVMMARRPIRFTPTSSSSSTSATESETRSRSREPSSGSSTWSRAVVFTLDGLTVPCLLPDQHHQEYHRRIAVAVGQEEVAETFMVLDRPEDFVAVDLQCLLVLRQGERRPITFLRLTLLDLEIIEVNEILPGAFRRLAKWLPHRTTRTSLFRLLSIEDIVRRHEAKTHLWVNNLIIDPHHDDPVTIEDGDYVKIFIGDDEHRFQCEAQSDVTSLLQSPAIYKTKIGEKHLPPDADFDLCRQRVGRRQRPRQPTGHEEDANPGLRALQEIWNRPHLQVQGPDNEPIMYMETWFLSALDFPRCSTSRLAAMPSRVQQWEGPLRQVWRDRQHPHWPLRIQLVSPTPVGAAHGGHLIIVQHEHPGEAGVLITTLGRPHTDQFAQLVPSSLSFDRLLWFADQEVRCEQRQWACHATYNGQRLSKRDPWHTAHGQHLELHVRSRSEPNSDSRMTPATPTRAEQPADSLDDFVLDPRAPEFVPGVVALEAMPEVIQDLHEEWTRTVFSWQGEEPTAEVVTWFVDQQDPPSRICWQPRNLLLTSHFAMWEHNIRTLWRDRIIDGTILEIVLIQPRPPQTGRLVAAHVLLVQRPQPELVTSLITVYDRTLPHPGPLWQLALTTSEHIFLEQLIHSMGLTNRCLLAGADRNCDGWYGTLRLILGQPLQGRDGYSIVMLLSARMPPEQTHHVAMLQTRLSLHRANHDRMQDATDDEGAQQLPTPIELNQLIPEIEAVKVKAANCAQPIPQYIEIPKGSAEPGAAEELAHWGLTCPVFAFGIRNEYLYFNAMEAQEDSNFDYMLCHDDLQDEYGAIMHTADKPLNEQNLMRLLHQLGYERAAILSNESLLPRLCRVRFWNCTPTIAQEEESHRPKTPWPTQTNAPWTPRTFFPLDHIGHNCTAHPCFVKTPFTSEDIQELIQAGKDVLCTDFTGLELPTYIEEALTSCEPGDIGEHWDRWLIFTDGSSQTKNKHYTPEFADAMTMPDTWAMLVVGERYNENTASTIVPIGWQVHPVQTDPLGSCFAGSTRIGADVAEKEGLLWAGLWRLSQDCIVPTVFCVDSQITSGQAAGTLGASDPDMTYRLLRGTFQCLQAGLPPGHIKMHHVRSHTGDPYNEFVDQVAKREALRSFHHKRLKIDMQKWKSRIPSLWLCVAHDRGLPVWNEGLPACAPDLPPARNLAQMDTMHNTAATIVTCQLSLATMNVQSISKGPLGHGGKLYYLYEQVKTHCLNIVGVQEGRSEEIFSTSHDILRIGAGQCGGQYGVELWVNLSQPVGYDQKRKPRFLRPQDFQVCHKDPQRLMVRCNADLLTCWILVAHAPHSGHPKATRQLWWEEMDHLIDQYGDGTPWIWLIDANAEPGDADDYTVFTPGLATSANTDFFRSCLQRHDLCIASTLDSHTGPRSTWTSPDGSSEHCLDYVIIPRQWRQACQYSSVIDTFDLCTTNEDHQAVGAQLNWSTVVTIKNTKQQKYKPNWHSPEARAAIQERLSNLVPCPWHFDVEAQAQHLERALHDAMKHSPQAPHAAKKPYITAELWECRHQKLKLKKRIHGLHRQLNMQSLRQLLRAWRHGSPTPDYELQFNRKVQLQCSKLKMIAQHESFARKLQHGLRQAKQTHLRANLEALDSTTPASGILRCLRNYIGPTNVKMCKKKTIPLVHDTHGDPCTTPEAALDTWVNFFKSMEGGQRITRDVLRERWRDNLVQHRQEEIQVDCTELPTLTDLEIAMRSTSCGKAQGADNIPGELLHFFPAELAVQVYPALWKLLLHGQEDLSYKGGALVQANKGRGPKHLCESFRSLLICSQTGKAIHRTIRSFQADIFEQFLQKQQVGGNRRMPVTYGLHQVRAHLRHTQRHGVCAAVVFVDLTEAFYRIFRPLCMNNTISDESLAAFLSKLNMPESALHELWTLLDGPNALHLAGLPEHLQRSIAAIHCRDKMM